MDKKKVGRPEGCGVYDGDTQCNSQNVLQDTVITKHCVNN